MNKWKQIHNKFHVETSHVIAGKQWQDLAERYIQHICHIVTKILDNTGDSDKTWTYTIQLACDQHNHTSNSTLGWITPREATGGFNQDINSFWNFNH